MAKAVKLSDIAELIGVSTVTVSKALADKEGVSDEMRAKIKQLAEELGYISKVTTKKVGSETQNIGVLIPERFFERSSFYWEFYHGIVSVLTEKGYFCILEVLSKDSEEKLEIPKLVQDQRVDGVIVIGEVSDRYMDTLINIKHIPTIVLDSYNTHVEYDAVISDGFYGMYILTNYLLRMGHRKIGFVGTVLATSSITDRYFGYQKALLEFGVTPNPEWIIPDRDSTKRILETFKLPDELPTAFACNCDLTAHVLIKQLKAMDLKVPDDISVVGFDNYLYSELSETKITTYEVNIEKMVKLCIEKLFKKIKNPDYCAGITVVTGTMIEKDSVKELIEYQLIANPLEEIN